MGLYEALAVLAEEWYGIQACLDPDQASRLREMAMRLDAESDPEVWADIAEDTMDFLVEKLPVGHPVIRALAERTERWIPPPKRDQIGPGLRGGPGRKIYPGGPPGASFGDEDDAAERIGQGGPPGASFGDEND